MTIATLQSDMKRCLAELPAAGLPEAVVLYFQKTVFPLIEAVVDEVNEVDQTVLDLVEQSEDILQPETAGIFLILIQHFQSTIKELVTRLDKKSPVDKKIAVDLTKYVAMCKNARQLIADIVVAHEEAPDEEEGDEPDATTPLISVPGALPPPAVVPDEDPSNEG